MFSYSARFTCCCPPCLQSQLRQLDAQLRASMTAAGGGPGAGASAEAASAAAAEALASTEAQQRAATEKLVQVCGLGRCFS